MLAISTTNTLSPTNMDVETKRQELLALDKQKKALTDEAEAIISELTAEAPNGGPPIGIDSPLVDAEGYPRADIDVYRARTLRKRFKEIQNDHKSLEKKIDIGLKEVAALAKDCGDEESGGSSSSNGGISSTTTKEDEEEKKARLAPKPKPKFDPKTGKWVVKSWDGSVAGVEDGEMRSFDDLYATSNAALATNLRTNNNTESSGSEGLSSTSSNTNQLQQTSVSFQEGQQFTTPFAIIDEVSNHSPSSEAGLKVNDVIICFGNVNSTNHNDFKAIAELVPSAAKDNKSITVAVRRKSTELGGIAEVIKTEVVELKPRTWAGRGLLGCHIIPYSE